MAGVPGIDGVVGDGAFGAWGSEGCAASSEPARSPARFPLTVLLAAEVVC
jgi:hypothetical protein